MTSDVMQVRAARPRYQGEADALGVSPGYKRTEVGVMPEDWRIERVTNFGKVVTGGTPSTVVRRYWNGTHPWVTPTDISESRDISSTDRQLTDEGLKAIRELPANTVLVTCIASIGKNAILRSRGGCNQQINAVIPDSKHCPEFLYYLFESATDLLLRGAGTTATPILSKARFSQLQFAAPLLAEQRAIAEALSDVDGLLGALEALIAKKRAIKQAAMQQLLTGKTRLPGFSGEWETKRLGELGRFRGGTGFPTAAQGVTSGDYPFFKVSDMNNDGNETFMQVANNYVSEQVRKALGATAFPANSIVFAKVGAAVFLERKKVLSKPSCLDNNMAAFVLDHGAADYRFIHLVFLNTTLGDLVSTTALPSLSNSILSSIECRLPPTEEQSAIATVLSDMDAEIAALEARRDKIRAIKQGMMQQLLTGRVRLVKPEAAA